MHNFQEGKKEKQIHWTVLLITLLLCQSNKTDYITTWMISLHGIKCVIASIISLPENNTLKHIETTLIMLGIEGSLYSDMPEYTGKFYLSSSGMDHTAALVYNLKGPSVTIQIFTRI